MRKTKTQKEFQQELKALDKEGVTGRPMRSGPKLRDSKVFYYGKLIVVIMVVMWLVSLFDRSFYQILDYIR